MVIVLSKSPFILNAHNHELFMEGSKPEDRSLNENRHKTNFQQQLRQVPLQTQQYLSKEGWNNFHQNSMPGTTFGMANSLQESYQHLVSRQLQEEFLGQKNFSASAGFDESRRASHQMSSDFESQSQDSWNFKQTPPKTKGHFIKKSNVSFIGSESTIDSDNLAHKDQMNSSFTTHFSVSSSFYNSSKQNDFNDPIIFDQTGSKQKQKEV